MKRTHYCGDLSLANDGEIVSICGWIQRRRDHGGLISLISETVPVLSRSFLTLLFPGNISPWRKKRVPNM